MTGLRLLRAGPGTTLQDAGRHGWLRFGVTPAGPMDWIGHATANLLAENPPNAGAIECGPAGLELTAEGGALRLGIFAMGFETRLDDTRLPGRAALTMQPGGRLSIRPGAGSVWAYVAVAAGFGIDPVMGSLATHLRSGIGPMGGRALQAGDLLPFQPGATGPVLTLPEPTLPSGTIRFVPGPQAEAFTDQAMAVFTSETYTVSARSDRMGYRFAGPVLTHVKGHDIVSDGIVMGAIQVPGDGQPIVLMADRQPTGGYPKIGTVIRADLPALAQSRAGQALRFRAVTVAEAIAALVRATEQLAGLRKQLYPLGSGPDLAKLASGDHASGFIDAKGTGQF